MPNQRKQTLDIPGIAKLTFNRVTQQHRYISVDGLVIDAYSSKAPSSSATRQRGSSADRAGQPSLS